MRSGSLSLFPPKSPHNDGEAPYRPAQLHQKVHLARRQSIAIVEHVVESVAQVGQSSVPEGWVSYPSELILKSAGYYVLFAAEDGKLDRPLCGWRLSHDGEG
jgi:hypothetical protein